MKKFIALLCIGVSLALLALTGCAGDSFTAREYSSGENAVESVSIDVSDRQIDIESSDDGQVHIGYFDGEKEYLSIAVSNKNELTVKLAFNKKWTDFAGIKAAAEYRKISVKLPASVKTLSVATTNEKVNIGQLTFADSLAVSDNGGDILFEKISVGKAISLKAKNGDIKGSVIGGWDDFAITCESKKGDCNLPAEKAGGDKALKVYCNNGNIDVGFIKS